MNRRGRTCPKCGNGKFHATQDVVCADQVIVDSYGNVVETSPANRREYIDVSQDGYNGVHGPFRCTECGHIINADRLD